MREGKGLGSRLPTALWGQFLCRSSKQNEMVIDQLNHLA